MRCPRTNCNGTLVTQRGMEDDPEDWWLACNLCGRNQGQGEEAMNNHAIAAPDPNGLGAPALSPEQWIEHGRKMLAVQITRVQDVESLKRKAEQTRAALVAMGADRVPELPWKATKSVAPRGEYKTRKPWTAEDDETLIRLAGEGRGGNEIGRLMDRQEMSIRRHVAMLREVGRL